MTDNRLATTAMQLAMWATPFVCIWLGVRADRRAKGDHR